MNLFPRACMIQSYHVPGQNYSSSTARHQCTTHECEHHTTYGPCPAGRAEEYVFSQMREFYSDYSRRIIDLEMKMHELHTTAMREFAKNLTLLKGENP